MPTLSPEEWNVVLAFKVEIEVSASSKEDVIKLTEKEDAVLKLIANNFTKEEIGTELAISDRSVNTLCRNLFKKTKTSSIVGLLKYAYANNLV